MNVFRSTILLFLLSSSINALVGAGRPAGLHIVDPLDINQSIDEFVSKLVVAGQDINIDLKRPDGFRIIHLGVTWADMALVGRALKLGADQNALTKDGKTALGLAWSELKKARSTKSLLDPWLCFRKSRITKLLKIIELLKTQDCDQRFRDARKRGGSIKRAQEPE